jgi:hypothetical protein
MKLTDGRTWLFILAFLFFPIIFHPWWMAVISIAVFSLVVWTLSPTVPKSN